ncbi:MAG TPA: HAMP domain-containing sensor histidine kinase [Actinomycetota bacterium]|nr:HAMP domain-containing sensor histidine kinase [Actinomycetota bacterium]
MRPRRRLLVAVFVGFALALLAGTLIPMGLLSARSYRNSYLSQRVRETDVVVDSLRGRSNEERARVIRDRYPAAAFTTGWLLDPNLASVAEPSQPNAFGLPPSTAPEVRRALLGPDARRFGSSPIGERLYIAVPLIEDGALRNVLWVSTSLRPVGDLTQRSWVLLGGIGFAALVLAVALGVALASRLSRRIEVLAAGAARFGEGRLNEPIVVAGRDEVAALATRLNEMAAGLAGSMDREKQFVTAASHQIRTPLTSIRLRLEAIAERLKRVDEDTREYVGEMIEEIDRLTDLSSKLLALGAGWSGLGEAGPVELDVAMRETVARLEPVARHRGVPLDVRAASTPLSLRAVPGAFEEVVLNLLDNALKFSPSGEPVCVSWREHIGRARIEIADHGPGISEAERSRVFEPFYSSRRREGGHGLGLTISAQLCEMSNATLRFEQNEGGGTLAVLDWPLEPGS